MNIRNLGRLAGFVLLSAAGVDPASALMRSWPGAAPCNTTFNACLASAQAGDTLRIVAAATIPDQISLSLPVSIESARNRLFYYGAE